MVTIKEVINPISKWLSSTSKMLCKNGIIERDIPGHVRQIAPKFQDGIRAFAAVQLLRRYVA